MSGTFKILSIDGGGFRGVYAAHILRRIEDEFSINWRKEFNLIAGTSTGSIIAAGLALGFSAQKIVELYKGHGNEIFKKSIAPGGFLFRSNYKNDGLRTILKRFFENKKLGDIATPLILPASDIGNGCVHVLKSSYDTDFNRDHNVLISDAVLASCSAPMFFPPVLLSDEKKKYLLADGGLWANNPSLVATIEARKRLDVKLEEISILSIGTGNAKQFYSIKNYNKKSLWGWGFITRWERKKFIEMILNLQSETANNMLGLLLNEDQLLRLNFDSDKKLPLDSVNEYDDLITRADRDFSHNSTNIKRFLRK